MVLSGAPSSLHGRVRTKGCVQVVLARSARWNKKPKACKSTSLARPGYLSGKAWEGPWRSNNYRRPLLITFGKEAHYGKIIHQHVELVYQGRGDARTQWRVQCEDGEDQDLSYDEILLGINTFAREDPRDALGNLKRIEIPRDRGEKGRPGALKGRRQQSQDEVDANSETDSDEGDEGLEADGDDNFDQGGDEDA